MYKLQCHAPHKYDNYNHDHHPQIPGGRRYNGGQLSYKRFRLHALQEGLCWCHGDLICIAHNNKLERDYARNSQITTVQLNKTTPVKIISPFTKNYPHYKMPHHILTNPQAWLRSNQTFQCTRDHPSHARNPISGGMWGAKTARLHALLKKWVG